MWPGPCHFIKLRYTLWRMQEVGRVGVALRGCARQQRDPGSPKKILWGGESCERRVRGNICQCTARWFLLMTLVQPG
jgi:hypothetical protein